jgi:hypothetical protein
MMDFAWKAVGVEKEGASYIIKNIETKSEAGADPVEKIYTFHIKEVRASDSIKSSKKKTKELVEA